MRNPRICADCRHCEQRRTLFILHEEYCRHPKAVDLVTGKAVWRARQLRDPGSRLCGASGRLWEAKEAPAPRIKDYWPSPGLGADPVDLNVENVKFRAATLKTKMDRAQDDATKQYHAYLSELINADPNHGTQYPDERVDGYGILDPGTHGQLKQMASAIGSPGAAAVLATVAPFAKAIKEAR